MKPNLIDSLVKTFFTCNKEDLISIFTELLNSMEAEETLSMLEFMSRNYETVQKNPEIHTLPGNLKDARDAIFPYFWGTDGWFSKLHLENVKGPANYASLIGALACLLKNPNLCVDTYSQRSNELEIKAITTLANLFFYHIENPWGIFTMGGTISNLYGGKIGIEKILPHTMEKGLRGEPLVGIVSQAAHYSNETLAGWLGIGTRNLHAIPTDSSCSMDIDALHKKITEVYAARSLVAFVIATFGSTDASGIDDVAKIRDVIDSVALKYGVPVPHLHVDAAAGWPLCFLTEYDTAANPFELHDDVLEMIKKIKMKSLAIQHADSVTIDFHKMGWGHYPSSAFIVRHRDDLGLLLRKKEQIPYFSEADYRHDPALFTLECSRPALGPYTVMASLDGIGLTGYQMLVAHALDLTVELKKQIEQLDYCKVLNRDCLGPHVAWWVLPKGRHAGKIYDALLDDALSEEEYHQFCQETARLFEKRKAAMNPDVDARLSFTTAMGYYPHGINIPAWKAVFFNPRTDRSVIDQLIKSIEEL